MWWTTKNGYQNNDKHIYYHNEYHDSKILLHIYILDSYVLVHFEIILTMYFREMESYEKQYWIFR